MDRAIEPELLDALPAADHRAIRSRRDLDRINLVMGSAKVIASELALCPERPLRVLELGAGDGAMFLKVVGRLKCAGHSEITLLDKNSQVRQEMVRELENFGWSVQSVTSDAFVWLREEKRHYSVIVANLFLHHFDDTALRKLFGLIEQRCETFIAFEPRRSGWGLFFSQWVWLIGCSGVTCHDAPVSVRAGFKGHELFFLWPGKTDWALLEHAAGRFGHLFVARRRRARVGDQRG